MREMKESGIPWIGLIPGNWKVEKLKYHFVRNEPRNPGNQQILSVYREYGVIPKDSRDDNHNVTSEDTSKYKYVKKGNLVINKMKAWQGSMGISEYEGVVSPAYFIYKFTDKKLFPGYIHYLLRNCYRDEFRRISGGIREGQWDLSPAAFENTLILIPTYSEQQAIADYLDAKCADIDALQQDLQAEIETLQAYKKSLITRAVTKGLDSHVEMKDSGVEWIGKIPRNWHIAKMKHLFYIKSGDYLNKNEIDEDGLYPVYGGGNLIGYYNKYNVKQNAALIGRVGARCGCVTFINSPCWATDNALIVSSNYLNKYYFYCMDAANMNQLNESNAQPLITATKVLNINIPNPPLDEQYLIEKYLDLKCNEIKSVIAEKQKQIEVLILYKKSLIYEVVTGKKEVPVHE